jgi:copper chaperone NosL
MMKQILAIAFVLLAACSKEETARPAPLEPDANAVAYFCHMSLPEHEGPKGQAFMRGQDKPYWFASASEAFVFLQTELFQSHDLLALYVNDMGAGTWEHPAPGAWIEIHQAHFVIGSSRAAAMGGTEAVPFADPAAAAAFAQQYGGQVVDFDAAAKALAVDQPGGAS